MDNKLYKAVRKFCKVIICIGIPLLVLETIYLQGIRNPDILHRPHEYLGYTYYSSKFDPSFNEASAEAAFDTLLKNEPEYKYLLDDFYADGYVIHFDDKFTYAWCTADMLHSTDYSACVTYDRKYTRVRSGMFVNKDNDYFSDKIFFHELSHYVDLKMGKLSGTDEFREIYEAEYGSSTLKDNDYYKDIKEYFAEESSYFILEDSNKDGSRDLSYGKREDAPRTFEYIKKHLEELKKAK